MSGLTRSFSMHERFSFLHSNSLDICILFCVIIIEHLGSPLLLLFYIHCSVSIL